MDHRDRILQIVPTFHPLRALQLTVLPRRVNLFNTKYNFCFLDSSSENVLEPVDAQILSLPSTATQIVRNPPTTEPLCNVTVRCSKVSE